ncbi:MAG: hypothetical protein MHM6MM_003910 [Cercozoa sp. M6MM]
MKLLLSATTVSFAACATASYENYYGKSVSATQLHGSADGYIKELQRETDAMRETLEYYQKTIDDQLRGMATEAASLRSGTSKLLHKVKFFPATTATTTTTATETTTTTVEPPTTTETSTTEGIPITVTLPPQCPTCEREGLMVQLSQECPADDTKRLGEKCLCDNECDANQSCSRTCTQGIPGTGRPLEQIILEDNFCLPQQKRALGDTCQCDADCTEGLICFDQGDGGHCLLPNGALCNQTLGGCANGTCEQTTCLSEEVPPGGGARQTITELLALCPSMPGSSREGQPCTCSSECEFGTLCIFIGGERKCTAVI